jgi:predicted oxidoreductase (fatty acid repression mutant protein)
MKRTFEEALANRRSYYHISHDSPVADDEIVRVIHEAVKHVPSAYNSQSTRIVLLLGDEHKKLWEIVKNILKMMLPEEVFAKTEKKINSSFESGHGTVLFFEDASVVGKFMEAYPLYSSNFKVWSQHTSAMHQFTIWTMLEDLGFGASLQHYNPLIDEEVKRTWHLPKEWELVAQMPFGMPLTGPGEKTSRPLEERVKVFK